MKAEFFHVNHFKTVEDFSKGLHEYIYYYNNRRIKSKLKMAPAEYRNQLSVA
ncbi:IS3 family transposase [Tepidibacter aestuarii]|uniref:IS3 family transposase n=1 Tax=Tepidibacter aestuarii TaxID=2925782 RepID=UPI0020BEF0C0|nr:IS3 family transposase [Tepidibacter aestuarii]CAH2213675.1 integrase catalytic domain-containing protein [Tepidibacter aestuarii]